MWFTRAADWNFNRSDAQAVVQEIQGVHPSMGTVGDAFDNAMAESFFATLECELIDRRKWETKTEARLALFTYIEGWYNPRRRHSALGHTSPAAFEARNSDRMRQHAQRTEHGISTVGVCVAGATPPVDTLRRRSSIRP